MATAIACLHRMHWTTFPRINAGLRRSDEPWLLLAVALVFAGEIILNVMPCVFPVLFLKALALVGGAGESKTRQQAHGMAYSAGILCSFWIIAGALLTLRALGKQAVWGFQLQSPGLRRALTCLLFFMALSLAGMFDLGMTLTSAGDSLARKGGYTGSFVTGVLATVVATPCSMRSGNLGHSGTVRPRLQYVLET